jgi:hypothetical protein
MTIVIIIAAVILYGFFCYVDKIVEDKHKEMEHSYGMRDEEITKEDE